MRCRVQPGIPTIALELSQRVGSVAVSNESGAMVSKKIDVGRKENDDLMPTIAKLCNEISVAPKSIKLVALSIGPGGFTGLRTSVAIAKMIALASGAKIVAVESAITAVFSSAPKHDAYFVLSGVKQESFWLSKVMRCENRWTCASGLSSSAEFQKRLSEVDGVYGDSFAPSIILKFCKENTTPFYSIAPKASSLLALGTHYYYAGSFTDPADLVPMYPREPEAIRLWKKKHGSDKTT